MIKIDYESKMLKEVRKWKEEIYREHKKSTIDETLKSILSAAETVAKRYYRPQSLR